MSQNALLIDLYNFKYNTLKGIGFKSHPIQNIVLLTFYWFKLDELNIEEEQRLIKSLSLAKASFISNIKL